MRIFLTVILMMLVGSLSCKRRQVTGKSPAGAEVCKAGAKPYRQSDGKLVCVLEDNRNNHSPEDSFCGELHTMNAAGECVYLSRLVTCSEGQRKEIIHMKEECVDIGPEPAVDPLAAPADDTDDKQDSEQPLLEVTDTTKLKKLNVTATCINNSCRHKDAKELICRARCAKPSPGAGDGTFKIAKVNNKGLVETLSQTVCPDSSEATLAPSEQNVIECYLTKGGFIFGWGSTPITAGNVRYPFAGLTATTVGKKYMCVEIFNDKQLKDNQDNDYLKIHNTKCDMLETANPKLQLEFSLRE